MKPWDRNVVKLAFESGRISGDSRLLFVGNNNARYIDLAADKARDLRCEIEVSDIRQGVDCEGKSFRESYQRLTRKGIRFVIDKIYERRYHAAFIIYVLEGICPRTNREGVQDFVGG